MADQSQIESFHAEVEERFTRAAQAHGSSDFSFCIADRLVKMSFAGNALVAPFTRAFRHLQLASPDHIDLTIRLWEIASTGIALLKRPWGDDANTRRGEVPGFCDERYSTTFHADGPILFLYDSLKQSAYVTVFDSATLPVYEIAAPLSPILFPALAANHIQYTHAAAVGLPEGGVILAGGSGAGKSTTALACLDSDLLFAGDDYCALRLDPEPVAYSLYNSAKADANTVTRLPFLKPYIQHWDTNGSGKAIWFLHAQLPHKLISKFPIRAILLPRITRARDTRLVPATVQAALTALAPTTLSQLPNAGTAVLRHFAALVRRVPAWHLELGTEMPQIPKTILKLLRDTGTAASA